MWEGFTFPDKDFFKIPNDFIESMARIDSMAELKVILYVMRHTWGYQEYDEHKRISTDEFASGRKLKNRERMDSGTGLGKTAIKEGLAKAVSHEYLECEIDDSDLARISKSYRLKLKSQNEEDVQEQPPQIDNSRQTNHRLSELKSMPYPEYLQTPEWAKKRDKALRFAGYRCQLCNSPKSLNVHHRTYERKGHELMGDLTVLCNDCHTTFTYNRELVK